MDLFWDAENGEKLHTLDAKVSPVGGVLVAGRR